MDSSTARMVNSLAHAVRSSVMLAFLSLPECDQLSNARKSCLGMLTLKLSDASQWFLLPENEASEKEMECSAKRRKGMKIVSENINAKVVSFIF